MANVRRGSIVVPSAGPTLPHPFKVEWRKGTDFKCFTGIIYDDNKLSSGEWEPKRFPDAVAQQMYVTQFSMSPRQMNRNRTKMSSKPYATGAKTGSLIVYSKPAYGRCTDATAVAVNDDDGCAKWDENDVVGTRSESVYLVLHNVGSATPKWCLSWVDQTNLENTDIRICVIKKRDDASMANWQLIQLWKSDLVIADVVPPKPFTVEVTGGAANGKLYCAKGEGTMMQGQWQNTGYLSGISVVGFAVYPTASLTWGTSADPNWVSNKGYVSIRNAASGGSDAWYVSLISNFDSQTPLGYGLPYLAVIANGSDAYNKTQPWGAFNGMPRSTVKTTISVGSSDIEIDDGLGGSQTINAVTTVSSQTYLNDYQCQRLDLAYVYWDSSSSSWIITQYHTGDIFWPRMFAEFTDVYSYNTGSGSAYSPPAIQYSTNNTNWFGTWTGYTKELSYPTTTEY
jgi:hypothetical protein